LIVPLYRHSTVHQRNACLTKQDGERGWGVDCRLYGIFTVLNYVNKLPVWSDCSMEASYSGSVALAEGENVVCFVHRCCHRDLSSWSRSRQYCRIRRLWFF